MDSKKQLSGCTFRDATCQGKCISEERDDSELKECGRGCKQHDPSGSAAPHVIAHYSGRFGIRARPYYNRQGDEIHSQAVGRIRPCTIQRPFANMQALHVRMKPAADCTLTYSPLQSDQNAAACMGGRGVIGFFCGSLGNSVSPDVD